MNSSSKRSDSSSSGSNDSVEEKKKKRKRIAGEGGDGWLWQKVGVGLLGEDDRRGEEKNASGRGGNAGT